jgi:hypothetical protein
MHFPSQGQVTRSLQQRQDTLPTPDQEEVSLLWEGVESAASEDQIHPSAAEINSIEAVLRERLQRNA